MWMFTCCVSVLRMARGWYAVVVILALASMGLTTGVSSITRAAMPFVGGRVAGGGSAGGFVGDWVSGVRPDV